MSTSWSRFDAWAMTPKPVTGAVVFRVVLAGWTAAYFAPRIPYVQEIYCREVLRWPAPPWIWLGDPIPAPWMVHGVLFVLFAALAGFAWGIAARWLHVLVVGLLLFLFGLDTLSVRAYGAVALVSWLLLWFAPYDRLHDESGAIRCEPAWGTTLLMLQFSATYALSVLAKLSSSGQWLDGRAVSWIANSHDWGRFGLSAGGVSRDVAQVLGIGTLGLEAFIGVGLWHPRTRPFAMAAVVLFHAALATSVRISILFGLLMLGHLVLFAPDSVWKAVGLGNLAPPPKVDETAAMPSGR